MKIQSTRSRDLRMAMDYSRSVILGRISALEGTDSFQMFLTVVIRVQYESSMKIKNK